jgi:TonB family protein
MKRFFLIFIFFISANIVTAQEEAPRPLNLATVVNMIQYPDSARLNGIEGRVTVKILVDSLGNVESMNNLTGHEVFHPEIKRVAMFLKFLPAKIDGIPSRCWITVPFNFKFDSSKQKIPE